ncbi:tetratricopeptide repeat protein [Streptomyces cupreus]|uniref:Tetratricopeptide repeat protein n=1 Tax=Streptomyces cupreus TaxID=2759956 RepID=A0A7X1J581_9ACTN|nr:tetratricopeptide repeat protein [Streptomyces cupreus]
MDAGLVWSAVGTLGTCTGLGLAWLQLRAQVLEHRQGPVPTGPTVFGESVAPPTGRLPFETHGRDEVMAQLRKWLRRPPVAIVILAGMGGIGKSTVAAALAEHALRRGRAGRLTRRVWWVSAADHLSLAAGLVSVMRQLGATSADLQAVASGAPDAPDRFWALLERASPGWLLIFDNADDPEVLAGVHRHNEPNGGGRFPSGPAAVSDGTGWMRPSRRGLTVVTSRNAEQRTWGRHALVYRIGPLDEAEGARVLLGLAPGAGDETEARRLARRLGGLPLALHLAGAYLYSPVARWRTFADYHHILDTREGARLLDAPQAEARAVVMRTWEISLDGLARRGVPHARALLRLLSCWAPATLIPLDLLDARRLACVLRPQAPGPFAAGNDEDADSLVEDALHGLNAMGLIEVRVCGQQTAVVLHPLMAETNRIHMASEVTRPGEPDARLVRRVAVRLITFALSGLRWYMPADWPRFRLLGIHVHAMLDTVAPRLAQESLTALISAVCTTGAAIEQSGAIDVGEDLYRLALTRGSSLGQHHPVILKLRHHLAWNTATRGRLVDSEAMFQRVYAVRRQVLGEDHPETLDTRHELAWIAAAQGRWGEAESGYRRVLPSRQRLLGENDVHTLTTRHELGWAIANQGRLEEAEAELRPVLRIRRQELGEEHPHTLATFHELAWITAKRGRYAEAEAMYRQLLEARLRVLGDNHHHTLSVHHELGWVLSLQGRWSEAMAECERTARARGQVLGDDHPETLASRSALHHLQNGHVPDAGHIA